MANEKGTSKFAKYLKENKGTNNEHLQISKKRWLKIMLPDITISLKST